MSFVPHTSNDIDEMLRVIGVESVDDLFDEIPAALLAEGLDAIPEAINEIELMRLMRERSRKDEIRMSFLGAGAYEHHIPAAIWDLVGRGEFLTAYTPYQAEASQGTLQLIYEFQTMMANLTAMEVSNASVYDGATALAEAMFMAVRANRKSKSRRILAASGINPFYMSACQSIVTNQDIEIVELTSSEDSGLTDINCLNEHHGADIGAIVISLPNFHGGLDAVDELTNWAHSNNALVIGVVNPLAMSLLVPPGEWGDDGADIAVGEGQPLGIPLSSGGPYFGFMCSKQKYVRQMPGRIIGRTLDVEGQEGFTLTLQAREQHIRRAKATSNICTNQGLLVTAATIYLSLMGSEGLRAVAAECHAKTNQLRQALCGIDGISPRFGGPVFHEFVIRLPIKAEELVARMAKDAILPGFDLGEVCPDMSDCLLVNVTETKSTADLDIFVAALSDALKGNS